MDSKKSPKGRKRTSKSSVPAAADRDRDEATWDCSVCTFKNNAEAFKCSMCDVRKGTSTRKPRLNPDIVALQQAQALTPPPPNFPLTEQPNTSGSATSPVPSSSKSEAFEQPEPEEEVEPEPIVTPSPSPSASKVTKKEKASTSTSKKSETKRAQNKARLKNVDRSSATYHSVTVDDFTVVITEFKPKEKKEKVKKEKISNGAIKSENTDKKDIKKEDSGEGPSRNGTSKPENQVSPNKDAKSKPGDSAGNEHGKNSADSTLGGSSNTNNLNHENGVNPRMTIDNSGRSS